MKKQTITSSSFSESPAHIELDAMLPSDESLMASIQQRDATALETLMQRYRRLLKSAIMRTVNDDAAAEDVLQECFFELWRQADHYSPTKGRPLAWIMTLGKRRAIDHLRRSMAYCRAKDRMEESIHQADTFTQDSAAECEQADMGRVINEHLSLLPDAQKEVIELAFLKGMSQREVAQATHCPLGTVKTRMELGLKKLRQTFRTRSSIHSLQAA
ncbi:sigma-70 family RNA polymerase sigma factor [Prosthecobacter sp.]|uniref:RNA polymerase sigma factor n=1 Tax=Prosthecobacter sp. TaxID=1965333 RepID=UPI0024893995|nr:sigma-70 family RNA polymerase sigma factor [Prosthecobacter sp.]MDI1312265.1 sigma-70 family RNA polymerase sigma factor [Prosthecobacter sp.]